MSYILEWKRKAFKNFNKLQKDVSLRISKKLEEVSLDPFRYLEHYEGDELFKLRIGEYRFLIDVDKDNKIFKSFSLPF